MVFALVFFASAFSLASNESLSCSDSDAKQLVSKVMKDNYTQAFGQAAYAVDPETLVVAPSEVTTIVSEPRHATCEATINFTAQPMKAADETSQRNINATLALFGNTRTLHASYEFRRTDDGDLTVKVTDLQ